MKKLLALVLMLSPLGAFADVRLPAIISDHMVVQAGVQVPIWGWATAGEDVTVTLGEQTASGKASADGTWQVKLGALKATVEPQTLTVSGKNTLKVQDVLVGEVWLGSGQSNMAMTVSGSLNYPEEQKAAALPQIRMFTVERASKPEVQNDCQGSWLVCSAETVGRFSAAAYFFGRELHRELKQPVGLINSSWGGTAVEAWTSQEAQSKLAVYPEILAPWNEAMKQPWDAAKEDEKYKAAVTKWKQAVADAKAAGKTQPRSPVKGVEPRLHQNYPANLYNGMIAPIIPYAIRGAIWYQGENNSGKPYLQSYSEQLQTLIADWRGRWGYEFPFAWVQLPDFNAAQKNPVEAQRWPLMREQMLKTLSVPKTGMAVTLGLGEAKDIHPKNKQGVGHRLALWALSQVYEQKVPAWSGPLLTKHEVKGNSIILTFDHAEGGLKSKNESGELKGFAIAGADRRFVWAQARVLGNNRIIVSASGIDQPVAVRYAWADNPVWSLQNGAGLPASPFRTDDWKIELKLAGIFGDHMVVQSGAAVPVWGWSEPGDSISVSLGKEEATTKVAPDGRWSVRLNAQPASVQPQVMTVKGNKKTLTVKDVLIGEVWLASGQSNMAFLFSRGEYPAEETAAANLPQVRMFTVKQHSTRVPQDDCTGEWVIATPETVQSFSAVAWFFGKDLHQSLKTPVGMINSSWGGTDIAAWTSEGRQMKVPALKTAIEQWQKDAETYDGPKEKEAYDKRVTAWIEAVKRVKAKGGTTFPKKPRFNGPPDRDQNHPANLFNGMIQPLIPYAIKGAIWYQGEHNCPTLAKADLYATQLPLLVEDWRAQWRSRLPFAWVQLPNFEQVAFRPLVREAMLKSLSMPNTGMAITIDVGEANDNHPKDKKTVGERLALWAKAKVYAQKLPAYSGPTPREHEIKNGSIHIRFNNAQGDLVLKEGAPAGFEVAGADQKWHSAKAKVMSNLLILSSPEIIEPVAARYAWSANPKAVLYNGAGLPASPFRTDSWPVTEPTRTP